MAIIATIHLPAGYDPREAVKIIYGWPKDCEMETKNVVAIQIEVADDLLPENCEMSDLEE